MCLGNPLGKRSGDLRRSITYVADSPEAIPLIRSATEAAGVSVTRIASIVPSLEDVSCRLSSVTAHKRWSILVTLNLFSGSGIGDMRLHVSGFRSGWENCTFCEDCSRSSNPYMVEFSNSALVSLRSAVQDASKARLSCGVCIQDHQIPEAMTTRFGQSACRRFQIPIESCA